MCLNIQFYIDPGGSTVGTIIGHADSGPACSNWETTGRLSVI